jgi:hypothetical protein
LEVSTARNDGLQACDAPRREGGSAKYSQSPMAAGNGAVIAIKWHVRGPAWWSILLTAGHLSGAKNVSPTKAALRIKGLRGNHPKRCWSITRARRNLVHGRQFPI